MKDCSELCSDPGFYLKVLSMSCMGSAMLIFGLSESENALIDNDLYALIIVISAGTFFLTNLALVLTYSSEEERHYVEILFGLIGGAKCLGSSVLLFLDVVQQLDSERIQFTESSDSILLLSVMLLGGLCMLIDSIRETCNYHVYED